MMRTGRPDAPVALVTGATGYLGRHLLSYLCDAGWQVHALTRSDSVTSNERPIHWHALDGSTERVCQILTATMPDVVFHLAAEVRSSHGVADVRFHRVVGVRQHHRDPALGVERRRIGRLAQNDCATAFSMRGQGGGQAGHPGADHHDIGALLPVHACGASPTGE